MAEQSAFTTRFKNALKVKSVFRLGRNPTVDWVIILVSFIVLTLSLVFVTYLHYTGVRAQILEERSSGASVTNILPRGLMDLVVNHFSERKANMERRITAPVSVVDPSL